MEQNLLTSSTQWPVSVGGHTTSEGMGLQSVALALEYSCALNTHSSSQHASSPETHAAALSVSGRDAVPEVMISSKDADGLQSLSQTHVVTQDPVQLVFVQEGEPVHSVLQRDKVSSSTRAGP